MSDSSHRHTPVALALGALGVVYGDIGTSPLYALKECFHGPHAVPVDPTSVLGVLSLVFWSLTIVIAVKYLGFVLRADNQGEGGIFALLALIPARLDRPMRAAAVTLGAIFAAALLYGDGIITPAISVLSAVEGLSIATDAAAPYVVPLTVGVLVALFAVQSKGTAGIGRFFGPITVLWFAVIAVLGAVEIARSPGVLWAVDPRYAVRFFMEHGRHGFVVLGAVVLCITGGEALYADLGHFGRAAIRHSWFAVVYPALLLNYFGQGARILSEPAAAENPFYALVPSALLVPMVLLATAATVIASQALISGAFSLTRQAIQLGFLPRMRIVHTSDAAEGQIYLPFVNWAMLVACVALVLAFGESSRLAAAYGIAVTGTMSITSVLYFVVARRTWGQSLARALAPVLLFLAFDLAYFGANLLKVADGGWLPLVVAVALLIVMKTWRDGRRALASSFELRMLPLSALFDDLAVTPVVRVSGSAVFLTGADGAAPPALLHHLKHNCVLHEKVVLLTIRGERVPTVPATERLSVEALPHGFWRVIARCGYMESPDVPSLLSQAAELGLETDPQRTSFYLGRETLLTGGKAPMLEVRKLLFAFLARNARSATAYFGLPPGRVVELGIQVDL
jgi:KUP system potassium uptake protein